MLWVELDPAEIPGAVGTFAPAKPTLELSLLPNPAAETTVLSVTLTDGSNVTVEIFDMMGSRVYQNNLPTTSGQQTLAIPVKQLIAGTYWVRVTDGKNYGITKLLVTK